jgi:hydroxyacylglutathione hydrolase
MKILSHSGGIAQTNCFLITDESTSQAVLFDAPDHTVLPLLQEAKDRQWDIIGLWLTHGHFDHVADHAVVTQHFPNAKVLIHALDEPKLIEPTSKFFQLPFTIPARKADSYLEDGQSLQIGSIPLKVIHTPGHSPGHVMFHFPQQDVLVGGDLIICGAVGRTDLPDSDPAQLDQSIRKIMKLPPPTRLLPGHCAATTLAEEAASNPYVIEAMASA